MVGVTYTSSSPYAYFASAVNDVRCKEVQEYANVLLVDPTATPPSLVRQART